MGSVPASVPTLPMGEVGKCLLGKAGLAAGPSMCPAASAVDWPWWVRIFIL